jgi:hypothetical protein
MFNFGKAKKMENKYKQFFGCVVVPLPFRYTGFLVHHRRLLDKEWNPVDTRFEKKVGC